MWESLIHLDRNLFEWIHFELSSHPLDLILPILRDKLTWIPVYVFIVYGLYQKYGFKKGMASTMFLLLAVVITNLLNSHFLKNIVQRERPCRLDNFTRDIQELVYCGEAYSFPSSHAANHFTISIFLILLLKDASRWIKIVLIFWATIICFAQVYVGVHYPSDVIAGFLVGFLVAVLVWNCYKILIINRIA